MDYFNELDALQYRGPGRPPRRARELVYIEEPEAHLFPSAQSLLMEFLIGSVTSGQNPRSLIITTHSPYIMGKINVFLKAGHLSRRKKRNQDINQIVPRECWLSDNQLSAFAINDGQLIDIMDREDHLIDGRYLDQISEDISRDFSKLLLIESEI
jgi:predicted ATPase